MTHSIKILWLAPNFNHYKARFLNYLAAENDISLTILSGTGRENMGDQELVSDWSFEHIKVNVSKKDFGKSKEIKEKLKAKFNDFDWVLIPAEKKNLPLLLYALKLRKHNPSVRLFSYNHPIMKSKNGKITFLDKILTKFYYKKLDRVVFYTQQSCEWAIKNKLIDVKKAFWANNTIDNLQIEQFYRYQLPPKSNKSIIFIGRLISSKRIDILIQYYNELKKRIPNLQLEIIGDGPERAIVQEAIKLDESILWHGTLIDEAKIAPIMKRASLVFVPGHSGLSINHAFLYGRPYITLQGPSHAPELDYIDNGINGYLLDGNFDSNIEIIKNLILDRKVLERFCNNANKKGESLSVQGWVQQMKLSMLHE